MRQKNDSTLFLKRALIYIYNDQIGRKIYLGNLSIPLENPDIFLNRFE